jgi:hypothetical protein
MARQTDPYRTAEVLREKPLLFVRVRDAFITPSGTRMTLPPPGQNLPNELPNGMPVIVEHRLDGTWALTIPNFGTWPLMPQSMPIPRRQLEWRDRQYHVPRGMRRPVRFLVVDDRGNRGRNLYLTEDGNGFRVGSVQEVSPAYDTDHLTPIQRRRRREAQVRKDFPVEADDILNPNISIHQMLMRRPPRRWKCKWLAYIIRARHGIMRKGDLSQVEEEITVAIHDHLRHYRNQWKRKTGVKPGTNQAADRFKEWNELRRHDKLIRENEATGLPIGDRRYID